MSYYSLAYFPTVTFNFVASSSYRFEKPLNDSFLPELLQLLLHLRVFAFMTLKSFSFSGERIFFLVSFSTSIRQAGEKFFSKVNCTLILQNCSGSYYASRLPEHHRELIRGKIIYICNKINTKRESRIEHVRVD